MIKRPLAAIIGVVFLLTWWDGTRSGHAQSFPSGPVAIILGVGAGTGADIVTRIIADRLSQAWSRPVQVLNQPGAGGALSIRAAGNAAPDGLTLFLGLSSHFIALPELQAQFPYDVGRDFVPIGFVGEQPMAVAAIPALGVNNVSELVALAKQKPGELTFAAGNRGGVPHLSAEYLRSTAGIDVTLVHYPATPRALNDVLGGRVPVIVDTVAGTMAAIDGGAVKPLAVSSPRRLPNLPNVPTLSETFPGMVTVAWMALLASPGTPTDIADKISGDLRRIVTARDVAERLHGLGTYPSPMSPAELRSFINDQRQLWKPIITKVISAGK